MSFQIVAGWFLFWLITIMQAYFNAILYPSCQPPVGKYKYKEYSVKAKQPKIYHCKDFSFKK